MYMVIVNSRFQPTRVSQSANQWFSYGPFSSFGKASKWACEYLEHLQDDCWHISQYIPVVEK